MATGTVSEMGPLLLSSLLELNDTQEGVLNIALRTMGTSFGRQIVRGITGIIKQAF